MIIYYHQLLPPQSYPRHPVDSSYYISIRVLPIYLLIMAVSVSCNSLQFKSNIIWDSILFLNPNKDSTQWTSFTSSTFHHMPYQTVSDYNSIPLTQHVNPPIE